MIRKNPYILSIIISIPFILWAILQILPTFDDWTTLSMPNYEPNYLTYILPLELLGVLLMPLWDMLMPLTITSIQA